MPTFHMQAVSQPRGIWFRFPDLIQRPLGCGILVAAAPHQSYPLAAARQPFQPRPRNLEGCAYLIDQLQEVCNVQHVTLDVLAKSYFHELYAKLLTY